MNKIYLNDGTVLDGDLIQDGDILWMAVTGKTFAEVCAMITDPSKLQQISFDGYNTVTDYIGFTHAFYVREESEKISVGLERSADYVLG